MSDKLRPVRRLDELEREEVLHAMKYYDGNRTQACEALGICIRTLRNHIRRFRKLGLMPPLRMSDGRGEYARGKYPSSHQGGP